MKLRILTAAIATAVGAALFALIATGTRDVKPLLIGAVMAACLVGVGWYASVLYADDRVDTATRRMVRAQREADVADVQHDQIRALAWKARMNVDEAHALMTGPEPDLTAAAALLADLTTTGALSEAAATEVRDGTESVRRSTVIANTSGGGADRMGGRVADAMLAAVAVLAVAWLVFGDPVAPVLAAFMAAGLLMGATYLAKALTVSGVAH